MGNRVVLTLLTVLALAAAGCGTVRARPAGLAAAVAATAARTSRVSVAVTTGAPGMWITFTGSGAFDYAHSRGWLRLGGAGFALEERLVPPRVYVKLPGGTVGANGKPWLAVSVDGPGSAASVPLMFPGPQADPADLLASLTGASARKNLGQATIQGARVTHYQVSVGTAQAVSLARPADRARLRAMLSALGVRAFPADVWVDRSGLVRRIRIHVAPAGGTGPGGAGAGTTETVTFSDFGVPVHVAAPPASQVMSLEPGGSRSAISYSFAAGNGNRNGGGFYSRNGGSRPTAPPPASGTLTPVQAAAAQQATRTFWSALGRNDVAGAAQVVIAAQRRCVLPLLQQLKFRVTGLRITSARPAGTGRAVVFFQVNAHVRIGSASVPVFPAGPGRIRWLLATSSGGHWYLDPQGSGSLLGVPCP